MISVRKRTWLLVGLALFLLYDLTLARLQKACLHICFQLLSRLSEQSLRC